MERPLWAEQRPDNWWDASVTAVRGALAAAGISGNRVKAIGLSGQMHGLVMLDAAGRVIRPALIWCDQRSQAQVDAVHAKLGRENVLGYIANPVLTGFTLPKLLWVRDHEPRHFERVRQVLLPKDYVRYRLTGEYASEVSDASGTALFDVVNRRWSFEMVDAIGTRPRASSGLLRIERRDRRHHRGSCRTDRISRRHAGSGRGGRSGGQRRGQWHRGAGHRVLHHRNLGRGLRPHGRAGVRSGRPRTHVLPRRPRQMARDGRYARRRPQPAVAAQPTCARHGLRRAHRRSIAGAGGSARACSGFRT